MYTQKKTKTTTIEIKTQAAHMAKTEMELLLELQPQDGGVLHAPTQLSLSTFKLSNGALQASEELRNTTATLSWRACLGT